MTDDKSLITHVFSTTRDGERLEVSVTLREDEEAPILTDCAGNTWVDEGIAPDAEDDE